MARRISRQSQELKIMQVWWIRILITLALIGVAYGFASLAINTANMFAYAATIIFAVWAIAQFKRSVQLIFSR
jgi:hypothetical protein